MFNHVGISSSQSRPSLNHRLSQRRRSSDDVTYYGKRELPIAMSRRNNASPTTSTISNFRPSLTSLLKSSLPNELRQATEAPFLVAAGQGKLSKKVLARWLAQDRLYAQAYISFISALLARVDLPYVYVKDKSNSLRWRILNMLTAALNNIHRELELFSSTAEKYSLDLDEPPRPDVYFTADVPTKQYIDLFRAFWTDPTMSLMEGLVVLWATEFCYFTAWSHAKKHLSETESGEGDEDGGALRKEFIPNWTSDEFVHAIQEIEQCTNDLAEREEACRKIEVYKAVWGHVLEIERRFWPDLQTGTQR